MKAQQYNLWQGDVLEFCRRYSGPKFHSMFCDPPYHLTSIVKRFGKKGSKPAKHGTDGVYARASRGFMGKTWDGGEIAFDPDTWAALGEHLYPGAFGMAFASSRGWHRLAVAIEDAGLIIHPSIFGWAQGQGFPKATRIKGNKDFRGYRYGAQALKPSVEPIIVFQKPYDGRPLDNILDSGAGAINIDGGRIRTNDKLLPGGPMKPMTGDTRQGAALGFFNGAERVYDPKGGRWPANLYLQHTPMCQVVGYKESDGYVINRFVDGAKPWGKGAGHKFKSEKIPGGQEPLYACVPTCPIRLLGGQGKTSTSAGGRIGNKDGGIAVPGGKYQKGDPGFGDTGTVDRYVFNANWNLEVQEGLFEADPVIYNPKVGRDERDSGLDDGVTKPKPNQKWNSGGIRRHREEAGTAAPQFNPHPTVKPIDLARWLATLLMPPVAYAPRRILVPFAGVASEMIGALMAGWESVLGIENEEEYANLGRKRLKHWIG